MNQYNPQKIEAKWQKIWQVSNWTRAKDGVKKPKFYCLVEFPYPSGTGLHVGHLRSYSALDAVARYKRMNGFNVLYPMGWDAFGLPAENYAIKTGIQPQITTRQNIANYKKQMQKMGLSFDWSREINTADPKYYKWTQWIFLQLFKKGLAYQKEMPVNWCPACKIGLANEEVITGKCERCGAVTTTKNLKQWMLRITVYADRLLSDLDLVDYSPRIREQQINWIGRSEGAEISFLVVALSHDLQTSGRRSPWGGRMSGESLTSIKVFTTRPDTVFGATYLVVCPEHSIIQNSKLKIKNHDEVHDYIKKATAKSDLERTDLAKEKTGVKLEGIAAINPANNKEIPIFVADYVLPHYGTGAIMAVPAHDQRDSDFALKYNLPIINVVKNIYDKQNQKSNIKNQNDKSKVKNDDIIPNSSLAYEGEGILVNSGQFNGLDSQKAADEIIKWLSQKELAKKAVNYKLRDWVFSRQHYWGEPIPIVHCEHCAKQQNPVLILHGWMDNAKSGFIPALMSDLKNKNYQPLAFDAPNTVVPNFEQWFQFAETKIKQNELKDFNLVGHSMGGLLALVLAEKYKLNKLVLVAPVGARPDDKYFDQFKGKLNAGELEIFKNYQNRDLDIQKIKQNVKEIIFVFGQDDSWINQEIRDFYIKNFNDVAKIIVLDGRGHMSEEEGVKRVSEIENLFEAHTATAVVPVPEKELPIKLPPLKKYQPTGTGESPLASATKWVNTKCPKCGGPAKRETDTMPNWAGSSWYFLRYCDARNDKKLADPKKLKYWLPVDLYNGGMEHTTLHLLYSRFWHKFLYDIGVVPTKEPYAKRRSHGVVLAQDLQKMSKSRGNVVNPDEMIKIYGADSLRIYEMFMGPFSQMIPWSTQGLVGVRRFLERIWLLNVKLENVEQKCKMQNAKCKMTNQKLKINRIQATTDDDGLLTLLHQTIKKVSEDLGAMRFNTAVAALMILTNRLSEVIDRRCHAEFISTSSTNAVDSGSATHRMVHGSAAGMTAYAKLRRAYEILLILLAPFAPHISEELWQQLGHKKSIFLEKWPQYDPKLIKQNTFDLVIQINGKLRDRVKAEIGISQQEAEKLAQASNKIKQFLADKQIKKVIFVKDKLINLVV